MSGEVWEGVPPSVLGKGLGTAPPRNFFDFWVENGTFLVHFTYSAYLSLHRRLTEMRNEASTALSSHEFKERRRRRSFNLRYLLTRLICNVRGVHVYRAFAPQSHWIIMLQERQSDKVSNDFILDDVFSISLQLLLVQLLTNCSAVGLYNISVRAGVAQSKRGGVFRWRCRSQHPR